jgi:hypothetical protein
METTVRSGDTEMTGSGFPAASVGWRPLAVLAGLFTVRVALQLVQRVTTVDPLPAFESWQSGTLPYGVLLLTQVIILTVQLLLIAKVRVGRYQPSRGVRRFLLGAGLTYLVAMVIRFAAGQTWADGHPFLDAPLPSAFHLVLATFVVALAFAGRHDADGNA